MALLPSCAPLGVVFDSVVFVVIRFVVAHRQGLLAELVRSAKKQSPPPYTMQDTTTDTMSLYLSGLKDLEDAARRNRYSCSTHLTKATQKYSRKGLLHKTAKGEMTYYSIHIFCEKDELMIGLLNFGSGSPMISMKLAVFEDDLTKDFGQESYAVIDS
jgi:hypothetical protein